MAAITKQMWVGIDKGLFKKYGIDAFRCAAARSASPRLREVEAVWRSVDDFEHRSFLRQLPRKNWGTISAMLPPA